MIFSWPFRLIWFFTLLQERDHFLACHIGRSGVKVFPEAVRVVLVCFDGMRVAEHLPCDVFALLVSFVARQFYDRHRTILCSRLGL